MGSTTMSVPAMQPDTELELASTRLLLPARVDTKEVFSFNAPSWIFVEKGGTIHAEQIYGVEFLSEKEKSDSPRLVSGGLIYTDIYGTVRKFFLADLATVDNITDPDSLHFEEKSDAYLADARDVYLLSHVSGKIAFDPASFTIQRIPGADATSFTVLSTLPHLDLAQDKHTVYLGGKAQNDIDRATFRTLKTNYFYRDAHQAYVTTGPSTPYGIDQTLERRSFGSLEKKIDSDSFYYSTDGRSVFLNKNMADVLRNGKPLERTLLAGADLNSFVELTGFLGRYPTQSAEMKPKYIYARDATHVYYNGISIQGASVNDFQPIENGGLVHSYGEDRGHVYYQEKPLLEADPTTFVILWGQPYEGCNAGEYSKDENHVYFREAIIDGADPKTFHVLIGEKAYGADASHVYTDGQVLPGADPKTFSPVCNYG